MHAAYVRRHGSDNRLGFVAHSPENLEQKINRFIQAQARHEGKKTRSLPKLRAEYDIEYGTIELGKS